MTENPDHDGFDRRSVMQLLGTSTVTGTITVASGVTAAADPGQEPNSENTVQFESLSSEAKHAFIAALDRGRYGVRDKPLPAELTSHLFVSYQGDEYRLNYRQYTQKNRIRAVEIAEDEITDDAVVRPLAALTRHQRDVFDKTGQNDVHERTPGHDWIFGFDNDIVRHQGSYYRIHLVHVDIPENSISPEKV